MKIKPILLTGLAAAVLSLSVSFAVSGSIPLTDQEEIEIDQGKMLVRQIESGNENIRTFEAIGLVGAPKLTVLDILTAYERYPEFMPNVSQIQIVSRNGDSAIVNYTLTLPMGVIKKYRVGITFSGQTSDPAVIQWQMQDWPGLRPEETIRDTNGYWQVEEKTRNRSLVLYHAAIDPGPVPFGLGWIVTLLSEKSGPDVFLKTKQRAEQADQTPR